MGGKKRQRVNSEETSGKTIRELSYAFEYSRCRLEDTIFFDAVSCCAPEEITEERIRQGWETMEMINVEAEREETVEFRDDAVEEVGRHYNIKLWKRLSRLYQGTKDVGADRIFEEGIQIAGKLPSPAGWFKRKRGAKMGNAEKPIVVDKARVFRKPKDVDSAFAVESWRKTKKGCVGQVDESSQLKYQLWTPEPDEEKIREWEVISRRQVISQGDKLREVDNFKEVNESTEMESMPELASVMKIAAVGEMRREDDGVGVRMVGKAFRKKEKLHQDQQHVRAARRAKEVGQGAREPWISKPNVWGPRGGRTRRPEQTGRRRVTMLAIDIHRAYYLLPVDWYWGLKLVVGCWRSSCRTTGVIQANSHPNL